DERARMDTETGTAELGGQYRSRREAERNRRLGAPQLARDDEVAHLQPRFETTRDPDQRKGRQGVEPGGEFCARATCAGAPGADDDVGTADSASLDPKRRQ